MESWVQWAIGLAVVILSGWNTNQMWEIRQLRAYRHRLGEDPCDALSKRVDYQQDATERRLTKIETKVFNGVKP